MAKNILIADDSSIVRKTLRTLLEKQDGWIVLGEAENGKETVKKAQELKPDVIVLDLSMPLMNGYQAALELNRVLPSVPVIMFTNFAGPNLDEIVLSAGLKAVVPKSEPEALVNKIQDLFASNASAASTG